MDESMQSVAERVAKAMPQTYVCGCGPHPASHIRGRWIEVDSNTYRNCPPPHEPGGRKRVTAADLLHAEHGDGRPSRWLWALFIKWVGELSINGDDTATARVWDGDGRDFGADGDSPIDAILRALGALATSGEAK